VFVVGARLSVVDGTIEEEGAALRVGTELGRRYTRLLASWVGILPVLARPSRTPFAIICCRASDSCF